MSVDRKAFMKMAGISLAALVSDKAIETLSGQPADPALSREDRAARRWAMVVDARKCLKKEGCDRCITACNQAHNIPDIKEPRHEIRWIRKAPFKAAFVSEQSEFANAALRDRPFVVLCNHCDRPPCVRVCPSGATWKRDDGIVMMDWHRCIGCRYCMAACPYGARAFNWVAPGPLLKDKNPEFPTRSVGVVEKCTFCAERLALGKPPACVAACDTGALLFGDLEDASSTVRSALNSGFTLRRKAELGTQPEVYYIV